MRTQLLRFNGAVERAPAVDAWMNEHAGELGAIAHHWFAMMRACGDEVRELLHDGCPVACLGDVPFGYVNVFTSHVNVGFFHGAALPDPGRRQSHIEPTRTATKPRTISLQAHKSQQYNPAVHGSSSRTSMPLSCRGCEMPVRCCSAN